MKIMARFALSFYVLLTLFLGVTVLLFVGHGLPGLPNILEIPFDKVSAGLQVIYADPEARLLTAAAALAMLFVNYFFMQAIAEGRQRERTIAFDNPTGRVSVSLQALEDLTRRVIAHVPEVKEVRAAIRAGKRGLEIEARLVLNTDVNIPEMTAQLQELIKRKVQDTIGIEETPTVRIHVAKIIPSHSKGKAAKEPAAEADPAVPFQGYRA